METLYKEIKAFCNKHRIENIENFPMSKLTSFKVGGPADIVIEIESAIQAEKVIEYLYSKSLDFLIVGNGSNLLVDDNGYSGIVLRMMNSNNISFDKENNILSCFSGVSLKKLCMTAKDNSLTGLEFAYGIPGTVGGGVFMNAGAYGGQISDIIISSDAIFKDNKAITKNIIKNDMDLGYRNSLFMQNSSTILNVSFQLKKGDKVQIFDTMNNIMNKRLKKQPLNFASAGSFFKRPKGHYAGALIEQSGLKGYTVGGAQVSEKHAGFIVNLGTATCYDILKLSEYVQTRILKEHGVQLEPEVRYIK